MIIITASRVGHYCRAIINNGPNDNAAASVDIFALIIINNEPTTFLSVCVCVFSLSLSLSFSIHYEIEKNRTGHINNRAASISVIIYLWYIANAKRPLVIAQSDEIAIVVIDSNIIISGCIRQMFHASTK